MFPFSCACPKAYTLALLQVKTKYRSGITNTRIFTARGYVSPRACVCACACVCVASKNQALTHTYVHMVKPAYSLWLLQNDCKVNDPFLIYPLNSRLD